MPSQSQEMVSILIASSNVGKVREFRKLLKDVPVNLLPLSFPLKVKETGASYRENAFLKARAASRVSGLPVIAEDSGLEIRGLDWGPGVRSKRVLGETFSDLERCKKILELLSGKEGHLREARFVSCICFFWEKKGIKRFFEGEVWGVISDRVMGKGGFGYDPIFFVPELGKTFAQMTEDEKNRISHRGRAVEKLKRFLMEEFCVYCRKELKGA